jgi:hypothetical protein
VGIKKRQKPCSLMTTEIAAKKEFPHEKWVNAESIRFKQEGEEFQIPKDIKNIKVARSRITGKKGDERILAKEIRQGKILTDRGASVYLIPKKKGADGKNLPGPDALVDGVFFEFKTITGAIGKVERHFRKSREQSENIFLNITNISISKEDVISKISRILRDRSYTGGTEGILIFYITQTEKTYLMNIKDLK